jgi:hypothetical protein
MFTQFNLWIGAAVGAVLMLGVGTLYVKVIHDPILVSRTEALFQAKARERAMDLIEKASKDHAEISSMDKSGACVELGGKWVPDPGRCD